MNDKKAEKPDESQIIFRAELPEIETSFDDEAKLQWCIANDALKRNPDAPDYKKRYWQKTKELAKTSARADTEHEKRKAFMALTKHVDSGPKSGAPKVDLLQKYDALLPHVEKAINLSHSDTAAAKKAIGFITTEGIDPPAKNTLIAIIRAFKNQ